MPFVDGETLRTRLEREKQLPVADALRLAQEVADALQYAHDHGVAHRDIKPENILLQGGHALVTDFGIALAVQQAGAQRMTQTGLSLGTPQYMAPEQAMGEKTIDARADIYALGAVTWEMLAGEPPFTGPTAQAIVAKVLTADPPALATMRAATCHRTWLTPSIARTRNSPPIVMRVRPTSLGSSQVERRVRARPGPGRMDVSAPGTGTTARDIHDRPSRLRTAQRLHPGPTRRHLARRISRRICRRCRNCLRAVRPDTR